MKGYKYLGKVLAIAAIAAVTIMFGSCSMSSTAPAVAETVTVAGPKGATGATGVGVTSATITPLGHLSLTLTDGTIIDAGLVKGSDGVAGSTGAEGAVGAVGANGLGIQSANVDTTGHLIITLTDSTTIDAGYVVGASGPAGTPAAAARITAATGNSVSGVIDVGGSYGVVITLQGTLPSGSPVITATNCSVAQVYNYLGAAQVTTFSGAVQFTAGSQFVTALGASNWGASMVGQTIQGSDGPDADVLPDVYTIQAVLSSTALMVNRAAAFSELAAYSFTVTVPSTQLCTVVLLRPTTTSWAAQATFSISVASPYNLTSCTLATTP